MSVWNKVLLVLVFLCAAGFLFLGANALKLRRDSQRKLADVQKLLEDEQAKYRNILYGQGQSDGYVFLLNDVNRLRKVRGIRSWPDCMPHSAAVVRDRAVTLQLVVDASPQTPANPDPLDPGLAPDPTVPDPTAAPTVPTIPARDRVLPGTTVYLFDKRPVKDGGCLLGEFVVDRVQDNIATLRNVYIMTDEEITRINDSVASLAPWGVYSILPGDIPTDALANLDPADAGNTSVDDETDAKAFADADMRSALGQTFVSLNLRRMYLQKYVDIYKLQVESLGNAEEKTKGEMVDFYTREIAQTNELIKKTERHLEAVEQLHNATLAETENLKELIVSVKALNKKILADLTRAQVLASEKINERDASLTMSP